MSNDLASLPAPAFYVRTEPGVFESTRATIGPWSPTLQHGGPPIALVADALDRLEIAPNMRLARVSVEILGPVPVASITIETEIVRPGSRIALVAATASAGGRKVLSALGWKVLAEEGRSPEINIDPAPPLVPPHAQSFFEGVPSFPYGEAIEWRFVSGEYSKAGPAVVWARTRIPLIEGEPIAPLARLLTMLDAANGVSAELDLRSWTFVPVDLNVVMHRHPEGEWVGMDARTTIGGEGIGWVRTRVFDARGVFGASVHTLFVAPR